MKMQKQTPETVTAKTTTKKPSFNLDNFYAETSDFVITVEHDKNNRYGLKKGQKLFFRKVLDFSDGDLIAINVGEYHIWGFGYAMTSSILLGILLHKPYPRSGIKSISKLVNPIKLDPRGEL